MERDRGAGNDSPAHGPNAGTLVTGLTKLWRNRTQLPIEVRLPLLQRVLAARGISGDAASQRFLNPVLSHLHDPSGIPDMDRAAERLLRAAKGGERIVIYGDYDVDGISATAILFHTLRVLVPTADIGTYVPHRLEEGYGLNVDAIREIAAAGAKVIVSVDCGVTAVEPAMAAHAAGADLIITDHHNTPEREEDLPKAYAIVHPRRPGSTYPFGELCGAGVAFKLAWRMATLSCGAQRVSHEVRAHLIEMLPLAALGVIADVVPLVDENRVIARHGLAGIRRSSLPGLRALVEASRVEGEKVKEDDVGFRLAPRLNACGRMGHAREAVELLTVATGDRARSIAEELTRLNDERRVTERAILERACELAEEQGMTGKERRAIVLAHPAWHAGVVGIVCSRMVERYHRPVILMSEHEGMCHGSGRSVEGFNLHSAIASCAEGLTSFGGHDMAAGLKLKSELLPAFVEAFTRIANERLAPEMLVGRATYDTDAVIDELTLEAVRGLDLLSPFGRENPGVRLRLPGVEIYGRPTTFGKLNKHLSFNARSRQSRGRMLRVVGWNWAERIAECPPGLHADLLVVPRISDFGGENVELELIDIRPLAS